MTILLWLVPALVATCLSMVWVSWHGRDRTDEADREERLVKFAAAMERDSRVRRDVRPVSQRERSTGIAVRRTREDRAGAA
ncbi:MAG: hypothetical protein V9G04_11380 [Nocardioides sp.]